MSNKKDISQIRKYLNGELDARAMHELERRAQDDPFLMDALEGYERAKTDQQANLDDLSARLQQRMDTRVRRLIPWVPVSIAASILIILGIGMWLITGKQEVQRPQLAAAIKTEQQQRAPALSSPVDSVATNARPLAKAHEKRYADTSGQQFAAAQANAAVPAAAPAATPAYTTKEKADVLKEVRIKPGIAPDTAASAGYLAASHAADKRATIDKPLRSKVDGLSITPKTKQDNNQLYKMGLPVQPQIAQENLARPKYEPKDTTPINEVVVAGYAAQRKKEVGSGVARMSSPSVAAGKVIMGRVTGKDDGLPIIGATVKVVGTSHGAVTNVNGQFALTNVPANQTLTIAFVGYNPKEVKINNKDTLNIALDPNNSALSEVVVTGYGVKHDESEPAYQDPAPTDGWQSFKKYLSENARSPDGKTGRVRLSFMVDAAGQLDSFKIIKSLSAAADQKAIDLVQHGPAWRGANDGKAHKVRVNVKFK